MIIAVDFDGVLCESRFPAIGEAKDRVIAAVKGAIDAGHEVILWTSRVEAELEAAVSWCTDHGLNFSAVNDAAPSNLAAYAGVYKTAPRKIYADYYIDDHGVDYTDDKAIALLQLIGGIEHE